MRKASRQIYEALQNGCSVDQLNESMALWRENKNLVIS
ncbi:hypothetical protein EG68_01452 [Paragonimus skrjabini miyazakii]|uniref:Uncharacterized protein n=1 Tax=Paragonimus skrjabini miyazakii TaxID=59628 RepID=A0A8S9Z7T3_9TREM|nr:hypothetical protein EG68_01452 [Paragonimus skrjabini miyazakii]